MVWSLPMRNLLGQQVAKRVPLRYSPAVEDRGAVEIAFDAVTARRGATDVLRGVSFGIERGETVALVGRSGAGKSTILKLVNRILVPDAGSIRVGGRTTTDWDPFSLRRHVGYVLQEVALFPHMSIAENVGVVPRLLDWESGRIDARVRELLDLTGLPWANCRAGSGSASASRGRWLRTRQSC